jgi:hypothetical protein
MNAVLAAIQSGEVRVAAGGTARAGLEGQTASQLGEPIGGNDALLAAELNQRMELQQTAALRQQLAKNVQTDPQDAGRLVENWMRGA